MIKVSHIRSMFNQPIKIHIDSLSPNQLVTLSSHVTSSGNKFTSYGHYSANQNGWIDIGQSESIGGTYSGVEPMGLFWSLTSCPGQRPGQKCLPRPVTEPFRVRLSLLEGLCDPLKKDIQQKSLDELTLERLVMADHVTRTEVKQGALRGTLFRPGVASDDPVPAVIDMYGTAGGLAEHRAAILASYGFATFALPFFNYPDLPKVVNDVDLNYFHTAIDWLTSQPGIDSENLGIIGLSLGADIAVLLASRCNKIKAAVPINGGHALDPVFAFMLDGKTLPHGTFKDVDVTDDSGRIVYRRLRETMEYDESMVHKIENSKNAHFLIICSGDDHVSDSDNSGMILKQRLVDAGKGDRCSLVHYDGAGHLLDVPYVPFTAEQWHPTAGGILSVGGTAGPHGHASEDFWLKVVEFFQTHLKSTHFRPSNFIKDNGNMNCQSKL